VMGEIEVVKVQATDPFMAVEQLDAEAAERVEHEVAKKRLYEVNGELAPSADSIDAAVAARELELGIGIEMADASWSLFKDIDPNDDKTWVWQATVRGANYDIKNKVRAGYNIGFGDAPFYMKMKDGTMVKDYFGYRKAVRIAEKKVKMICLGDKYRRAWHERTLKMLKAARKSDTAPRAEDMEAIRAARRQMGVPEGGPSAASESPPPAPSQEPLPARPDKAAPGGGGDPPVQVGEWGSPGDGGKVPTLKQMQWFTAPARGDRRMTEAQVRAKTRVELVRLRDEWGSGA